MMISPEHRVKFGDHLQGIESSDEFPDATKEEARDLRIDLEKVPEGDGEAWFKDFVDFFLDHGVIKNDNT